MKNDINNLINNTVGLFELIKSELEADGYSVNLSTDDNSVAIEINKVIPAKKNLDSLIQYFKDYVNDIPDYMLLDVFEEFNKNSKVSLSEFSSMVANKDEDIIDLIAVFKEGVNTVAQEYVEELTKKYLD